MKGFIAVVLAQAQKFSQVPLRQPIHVAISYDEEVGCLGIDPLLRDLEQAGIRPDGCIVGEPTSMRMVTAHKGARVYKCRVHGRAAHSSLTPSGVNAIEYAARLISHIQDIAIREEAQGHRLDGMDVPYSTISTNLINGGSGSNIVPALCEFVFDYRYVPGVAPDAFFDEIRSFAAERLEPRMKRTHAEAGIVFERLAEMFALDANEQAEIAQMTQSLLRDKASAKVSYGTEAGFFQRAGIPSIVCGPGSIEQAHRPDEYVPLAQLHQCERFVDAVLARLTREAHSPA
jgi:acetylornithine deacetylase